MEDSILPRVLFILPTLPRDMISVRGLTEGREAVSGSHSSVLLVADGLARRGHDVGILVPFGQELVGTCTRTFTDTDSAFQWVAEGLAVLCSWGGDATLDQLNAARIRTWIWLHVDLEVKAFRSLESGRVDGIIVVSDTTRMPFLHGRAHRRLGTVYNPLNPFFLGGTNPGHTRYGSRNVVFAGYIGETKGAHRVLAMWPHVRKRVPDAVLSMAGSGRLYGSERPVGRFGVAAPEFEEQYLEPLVAQFGSLEAAGVRLVGLLQPEELIDLYRKSSLGFVNFNWNGACETFCCSAVEMLATELPVFSFAVGALPETIGVTGGAVLANTPDLSRAADSVAALLGEPERLRLLGSTGNTYVREHYALDRIVDGWERVIAAGAEDLEQLSGRWRSARNLRYWLERTSGRTGCGRVLDSGLAAARSLRRFT